MIQGEINDKLDVLIPSIKEWYQKVNVLNYELIQYIESECE